MDTKIEIQIKIKQLVDKWKDKVPLKYSSDYWRYRADRLLFSALKSKLQTDAPDKNKAKIGA